MEKTYLRVLKKIVLTHRTLLVKNIFFLEIASFFSENERKHSNMGKNIKYGSELSENQYTDGTYLLSW